MVTTQVRLMVLYDVESRIMQKTTVKERKGNVAWQILQEMIEDEYKHRDALERSGL